MSSQGRRYHFFSLLFTPLCRSLARARHVKQNIDRNVATKCYFASSIMRPVGPMLKWAHTANLHPARIARCVLFYLFFFGTVACDTPTFVPSGWLPFRTSLSPFAAGEKNDFSVGRIYTSPLLRVCIRKETVGSVLPSPASTRTILLLVVFITSEYFTCNQPNLSMSRTAADLTTRVRGVKR